MAVEDVVRHGTPTLAGLKTGNLCPCSFSDRGELLSQLRLVNRVLVPRGLRLLPLRLLGLRSCLLRLTLYGLTLRSQLPLGLSGPAALSAPVRLLLTILFRLALL